MTREETKRQRDRIVRMTPVERAIGRTHREGQSGDVIILYVWHPEHAQGVPLGGMAAAGLRGRYD